jgi:hypothetical protein
VIVGAQQLQFFRIAILRVLESNPTGKLWGLPAIAQGCQQYGFSPSLDEVKTELSYLHDPPLEFVKLVDKANFSPEVRTWQITTRGRNFLAEQNE